MTKSIKYVKELIEHWCKVNKKTKEDFAVYEGKIQLLNRRRVNKFYQVKVGRRVLV